MLVIVGCTVCRLMDWDIDILIGHAICLELRSGLDAYNGLCIFFQVFKEYMNATPLNRIGVQRLPIKICLRNIKLDGKANDRSSVSIVCALEQDMS